MWNEMCDKIKLDFSEKPTTITAREALKELNEAVARASIECADGFKGANAYIDKKTNALKVLEALVIASEQTTTLEKLGYERINPRSSMYARVYRKGNEEIVFYDYEGTLMGSTTKQHFLEVDKRGGKLTYQEIPACAAAIQDMKKE